MSKVFLDKALKKISWKTIYEYYKKSRIEWKFQDENDQEVYRLPTLEEIKDDLICAINFVFSRNLASMDYGNWIIYWTDQGTAEQLGMGGAQLEVLFVLTGALINKEEEFESKEISNLTIEDNLQLALKNEDYELAARLRDQMNKTQKRQPHNLNENI
jgi:hypothetical protein